MSDETIGIVGGGIVGLAVGRELSRRRPGVRVVVFEKEDRLAAHQTGHNSGVVHAGLYYKPGSLKAELCARGRALIRDYCAEHGLPYDECGKLVVAVDPDELGRFAALEQTARRNDVPGLRRVDGAEITEIEPHAAGLAALHSPHTAITDYVAIAERAGRGDRGRRRPDPAVHGRHRHRAPAGRDRRDLRAREHGTRSTAWSSAAAWSPTGSAGWSAARRRRGSCRSAASTCRSSRPSRSFVRGMIYPVPDPRYPFLGVHFTRRVDGTLEVGPNAFLALSRQAYGRLSLSPRDLGNTLAWPGLLALRRRALAHRAHRGPGCSRSAPTCGRPSATCPRSAPPT